MTREVILYEGAFTADTRASINSNFQQLFAGQDDILSITASATITSDNAPFLMRLDAAAGLTITLPAATGTGNLYRFVVGTTVTSNSDIIRVANSTDVMSGVATMGSSGGTSASVGTAAASDTITLNGTTTGGIRGTYAEVQDIASGLFRVSVHGVASGTAATPFSATV